MWTAQCRSFGNWFQYFGNQYWPVDSESEMKNQICPDIHREQAALIFKITKRRLCLIYTGVSVYLRIFCLGVKSTAPGPTGYLNYAREGDTIIVTALIDRVEQLSILCEQFRN